MNHQDRNLIKQLAESQPAAYAHTLPADVYLPGIYDVLDKTHVLANSWQFVAFEGQLAQVGDYVVHEIVDQPIIVVRSENGLKAFHNVCRHRAGPLAFKNGHAKTLMCKYHGWNYHLDGRLKSAPEMHTTVDFDVCNYQLPEIKLANWQGLVFVALKKTVPVLSEVFSGIKQQIAPIDLNSLVFHHRDEFVLHCNWKVYVENYLEGYHLPHIHPGLSQVLDYKSYQTELHPWYSYQHSPLDVAAGFYGEGQAHYYFIYPNTMLNILPNRLQLNQVLPMTDNRTKVIFDYCYQQPQDDDMKLLIEQDQSFSDEVQAEDIMICEAVQKGLNSGSYEQGRLCSKREMGVYHFQELIRAAYMRSLSV